MPAATYDALLKLNRMIDAAQNEAFFVSAGEKFTAIDGWLPAAALYYQAAKNYGVTGKLPADLQTAFHEAVYKGFERQEAPMVLPYDKLAQVDQPIALIAQARNTFYVGRIDEAVTYLNQVKQLIQWLLYV